MSKIKDDAKIAQVSYLPTVTKITTQLMFPSVLLDTKNNNNQDKHSMRDKLNFSLIMMFVSLHSFKIIS